MADRGPILVSQRRPHRQPEILRRLRHDEVLVGAVDQSFKSNDRTSSARGIWHDVLTDGLSCDPHRVERLMRKSGLRHDHAGVGCRRIHAEGYRGADSGVAEP